MLYEYLFINKVNLCTIFFLYCLNYNRNTKSNSIKKDIDNTKLILFYKLVSSCQIINQFSLAR